MNVRSQNGFNCLAVTVLRRSVSKWLWWHLALRCATPGAPFTLLSCEQHPLQPSDRCTTHSPRPALYQGHVFFILCQTIMLSQRLKSSPLGVHHGVGQTGLTQWLYGHLFTWVYWLLGSVLVTAAKELISTTSKVNHIVLSTHFFIKWIGLPFINS